MTATLPSMEELAARYDSDASDTTQHEVATSTKVDNLGKQLHAAALVDSSQQQDWPNEEEYYDSDEEDYELNLNGKLLCPWLCI